MVVNKNMKLTQIIEKVNKNIETLKKFPHITDKGKWTNAKDTDWTDGFWIGLLWLCYKLTSDKKYAKAAYKWLEKIEHRKRERTFNLGFLFYYSYALGYEIVGDENFKKVALEAADTLSTFFDNRVKLLYNIENIKGEIVGRSMIDIMMNLPLLWWAYKETNNEKYYSVAYEHSKSTIKNFIRDNFSTLHVIDFDLKTGNFLRKITIQGYNNESCWSRGQAWAMYGFALAYETSKDEQFLKAAENLSDYFIANLPEDFVPYWDFDDPEIPNAVKDSSAAAIASSALLTLSEFSGEERFREYAVNILSSLYDNYLSGDDEEGILKHGCYHRPENRGVNESLIWGDYYFVEAIIKIGVGEV